MIMMVQAIIFFLALLYLYGIAFLEYKNPLRIPKILAIVFFVLIFFILPIPVKAFVIVCAFFVFVLLRLKLDKKIIKFIKELDSDKK